MDFTALRQPFLDLSPTDKLALILEVRNNRLLPSKKVKKKKAPVRQKKALEMLQSLSIEDRQTILAELEGD